jgi:hypothetical protein
VWYGCIWWILLRKQIRGLTERVYTQSPGPKRLNLVSCTIGGRSIGDLKQLVSVHFCEWNASSVSHGQSCECFNDTSCVCVKTCVCIQTEACTKFGREEIRGLRSSSGTSETWIPWGSVVLSGCLWRVRTLPFWLQVHYAKTWFSWLGQFAIIIQV